MYTHIHAYIHIPPTHQYNFLNQSLWDINVKFSIIQASAAVANTSSTFRNSMSISDNLNYFKIISGTAHKMYSRFFSYSSY